MSKSFFLTSKSELKPVLSRLRFEAKSNKVGSENMPMLYFRELRLKGIGYRCVVFGSKLFFKLGFGHYILCPIPKGLNVRSKKDRLVVFGSPLSRVSAFSSQLTKLRSPDAYKAKGISDVRFTPVTKVGKRRK